MRFSTPVLYGFTMMARVMKVLYNGPCVPITLIQGIYTCIIVSGLLDRLILAVLFAIYPLPSRGIRCKNKLIQVSPVQSSFFNIARLLKRNNLRLPDEIKAVYSLTTLHKIYTIVTGGLRESAA